MQRSSVDAIRTFLDADILVSIAKYSELAGHRYHFLEQERSLRSSLDNSSFAQLLYNKPFALKDIEKSFDYFFTLDRFNYRAVHSLSRILKESIPNNKILFLLDIDNLNLLENGESVKADNHEFLSINKGPIISVNRDVSQSAGILLNSESSDISLLGSKLEDKDYAYILNF